MSSVKLEWDHGCSLQRGLLAASWEVNFGSYKGVFMWGHFVRVGVLSESPVVKVFWLKLVLGMPVDIFDVVRELDGEVLRYGYERFLYLSGIMY